MEETLQVDYDVNPTPLYTAICNGEWEAAASLTKSDPIQAKTWVIRHDPEDAFQILWRFLPLHSACARQPPDSLVEALLTAYPDAASSSDDQGFLPLHYACGNRASDAVVNMLLIIHPQAAMVADPYGGKLPLHHLSQWGTYSAGVVNMLLAICPEAIHIKDSSGMTPLDLAKAANYPGRNVVIMALKRCGVASKFRIAEEKENVIDAAEEREAIQEQGQTIQSLQEEVGTLREEVENLSQKLHDEQSLFKTDLQTEQSKKQELESTLSTLKNELKELKDIRTNTQKEYSNTLQEIQDNRYEIMNLRQEKEQTLKERDTLAEKLSLKSKTFQDTITSLQSSLKDTEEQLENKARNNEGLNSTLEGLQREVDKLREENETLKKELEQLKIYKNVSHKMDDLEEYFRNVMTKYHSVTKKVEQSQKNFKAAVIEREAKILEIAQLEEKLRSNSAAEHTALQQELEQQCQEMQHIISIIQEQ